QREITLFEKSPQGSACGLFCLSYYSGVERRLIIRFDALLIRARFFFLFLTCLAIVAWSLASSRPAPWYSFASMMFPVYVAVVLWSLRLVLTVDVDAKAVSFSSGLWPFLRIERHAFNDVESLIMYSEPWH